MKKALTARGRLLALQSAGKEKANELTLGEALELVDGDRITAAKQIQAMLSVEDDEVALMAARQVVRHVKKG